MEITKLKNTIPKIKNTCWMGLIVEMTEDRTTELEERQIKFIPPEQQRENRQIKDS